MNIKASIIIRTYNEEDWIAHCLKAIQKQTFKDYEIIIVDNYSTDNTLKIAKTFDIKKIVKIKNFIPGKALNMGCKVAKGEFLVFLSAHCIPEKETWLKNLIDSFKNKKIAAVYGKQSPIKFSDAEDIRDLYITFGNEKKIQKKDHFFHNANSAIRRSIWKDHQFSNSLTNIEDRFWSKKIIDLKYWIAYEPNSNVFHYHGIHHGRTDRARLNKTIKVIEKIENNFLKLPDSLKPENVKILFIINFSNYKKEKKYDQIFLDQLYNIESITTKKKIIFIKPSNFPKKLIPKNYGVINMKRNLTLTEILKNSIKKITDKNFFPDYVLYVNMDYIFRPKDLFNNIINQICIGGFDTVIPSLKNFNTNFVYNEKKLEYEIFGKKLNHRADKMPYYTNYYGLGTIVKTKIANKGLLISENKNSFFNFNKKFQSLRISEIDKELIKTFSNFKYEL